MQRLNKYYLELSFTYKKDLTEEHVEKHNRLLLNDKLMIKLKKTCVYVLRAIAR